MQLASPISLFWLTLAIPIVAFYVLKIRMRRVPVSTVMFWHQIFEEKKPRSIWQRLRHLISLLLQLAFLGLLVIAVADPFFASERLHARRVVLIVDNSASMQAQTGRVTRLEAAKQRGERLISGLRVRDQMAIISAGTVPRIATGLTHHQRTLTEALDGIAPTDGPTEVERAVTLARRLLMNHDNGQIVVLSDGCFATATQLATAENKASSMSPDRSPTKDVRVPLSKRNAQSDAESAAIAEGDDQKSVSPNVQLHIVGEPVDNLGITQFQIRRSLVDVIGYQVLVEVTSFSERPTECRLEMTLDENLVDVIPLRLEPGERQRQIFEHTSSTGGQMIAQLDFDDGLATDNRATAILPKREPQPVVLVTEGNLFLQSALAAIPLVRLETVTELPDEVPRDAILFFDGKSPEQLPNGNVFVVEPTAPSNFWKLGNQIDAPIVTEQESDSELMTHVQLENVVMPTARRFDMQCEHQVLARSIGGDPLYAAIDHADGKVLILSVDLKKGDLPLRTAFPIMVMNAIRWFRGERAELQQAVPTGAIVECHLGATTKGIPATLESPTFSSDRAERFVLRRPDGTDQVLPNVDRLTLGPLDQVGVWQVRTTHGLAKQPSSSDRSRRAVTVAGNRAEIAGDRSSTRAGLDSRSETVVQYACNLANAAESDLRPAATFAQPPATYGGIFGGRPIWFYLIGLAFALTTLEWFLYQRRWIS